MGSSGATESIIDHERENMVMELGKCIVEDADKERKLQYLAQIMDITPERMHGYVFNAQLESDAFAERAKRPKVELNTRSVIAGYLFENLATAEFNPGNNEIAEEVLSVLHNAKVFDLFNKLGQIRNPDLAYIEIDPETQNITIIGAGECKLGLLDWRAVQQLTGKLGENIDNVCDVINNLEDKQAHGLLNIAESGKKLEVGDRFVQTLIVPKDRDISSIRNLINFDKTQGYERAQLYKAVENGRIIVKKILL